jgi:hypothetical protein
MPAVNGIPSTTEILRAVGLTRAYPDTPEMARYRARGTALHQAIQWFHAGVLDEESLHPEIAPGFSAYRAWLEETGWKWLASEVEIFHPWGYVSHLDLIGEDPEGGGGVEILDVSPDLKSAAFQLAAYGLAYDHAHPEAPHVRRRVLQLSPSGWRAKAHDVTDAAAVQVFAAAVIVHRAQREVGR